MKRSAIVAGAIVMTAVITPGASSDTATISDPDDAPSVGLDIQSAAHGHVTYETRSEPFVKRRLIEHTLTAWDAWSNDALDAGNYIAFHFFVPGDRFEDKTLYVEQGPDGTLFGEMRDSTSDTIVGFARVTRPSEASVEVAFPKRLLRANLSRYRWSVTTFVEGDPPECSEDPTPCPRQSPTDNAPETGTILHMLKR